MSPDPAPPRNAPEPQVHGWKDISTYFGRSVRTVQRWEREFGLPIRRYGFGRGEVVHAYIEELERWRATAEAEAAHRGTNGNSDHPTPSEAASDEMVGTGRRQSRPGLKSQPPRRTEHGRDPVAATQAAGFAQRSRRGVSSWRPSLPAWRSSRRPLQPGIGAHRCPSRVAACLKEKPARPHPRSRPQGA